MSKKGQRYFSVEDKKSRDGVPDVSEKQKETVQTGVKSKKKPPIMEVIMVDNSKTLPARKRPDFSVKKIRDKRKLQRLEIPLNPAALKRHSRGEPLNLNSVKTDYRRIREKRKDIQIEFAEEQAARAEILLDGEEGFLEADEGESTTDISQKEIVDNVDITTATKHFTLALDFGPYRMRYTKNGTHLLLGGRRGHLAAFSWIRKKLQFEMNVMESVHDVTWLMNYTMFAAAQKEWVHVYDKKGTELHCIKSMHRSQRLEYLPYHFLLCSASESGFLSWMDVSIGQTVATYNCRVGKLSVMTHNPWNGVTCVADSKGVVSMWSPTVRDPLAKMLCHPVPLTALSIDPQGMHMATAALDRKIKIWDIRQLEGPLETYHINTAASDVNLSQRGLMALSLGNVCEIYRRNPSADQVELKPYIRHRTNGMISNLRFCPYEDVLGVATQKGFTSLIVPGSGEPNFDTFEANPFQSRTQRREEEVHSLLEKIPAEFISLNPNQISEVDVPSAKARLEEKVKQLTMKPPKINFEPRNRKGITKAKRIKIKQNVRETRFREAAKEILETKEKLLKEEKQTLKESPDFIPLETKTVLDRFQTKKKKKTRQ